jgi:hypothetical protein
MRRIAASALLAAAVTVAGSLTTAAPAAADDVLTPGDPVVVASGLNNPRQLVLLGGRSLLIAEAGGGSDTVSRCAVSARCPVGTGSIALIRDVSADPPVVQRIVTGLLSSADPDGGFAVGPDGVGARGLDAVYIAMTGNTGSALRAPRSSQAGKLLLNWRRQLRTAADISAVEQQLDPDGQGVDSNPYAVLALADGRQLVADAGGNDILEVRGSHVRVFAVLPNRDGHQPVPTSLALGPDGFIYVGGLHGGDQGAGRVWRLSRSGQIVDRIDGFSLIAGIAVGPTGTVYVSELLGGGGQYPGRVVAVLRNGSRVYYPVPFPAGLAVDLQRQLYVSAWSISDSDGLDVGDGDSSPPGQIWRLTT